MKKLFSIILLLGVSFAFAACSDDDDGKKGGSKWGENFVWKGDWNDPENPNHKPEGYNPIQGLWKNVNTNTGLYFSADRIEYRVIFHSVGSPSKSKYSEYEINDQAYRTQETWLYKIEGEILYIKNQTWNDDEASKYRKVEE